VTIVCSQSSEYSFPFLLFYVTFHFISYTNFSFLKFVPKVGGLEVNLNPERAIAHGNILSQVIWDLPRPLPIHFETKLLSKSITKMNTLLEILICISLVHDLLPLLLLPQVAQHPVEMLQQVLFALARQLLRQDTYLGST